ncbi:filamentous hemagglutinin N-terminal domain-containing protein [Phascolarctobacterium sp.]
MKIKECKYQKSNLARRLTLSLLIGGMFVTTTASAMPSVGDVVTGNGTIGDVVNNVMSVTGNSSSANVAIKWQDFGIGKGETVNFTNMNAVLNYVTGNNKSEIFGKLNGSGVNVFLINPNGVLFGAGAEVSVGSLYTSTARLDESKLSGFSGSVDGSWEAAAPAADVVNLGTIKADKLTIRGGNITLGNTASITKADGSAVTDADKANYVLQSNGAINVGYEVARTATLDVGDGQGNHAVANYIDGTAATGQGKGSALYTGQKLDGTTANTINDYMLVKDVYDLQNIDSNKNGKYMLAGNIDASVTDKWNRYDDSGTTKYSGFDPLGYYDYSDKSKGFNGVFDGLGYTIDGLTIDRGGEDYVGLFGYNNGAIRNVGLINGSVSGKTSVGGIAGVNDSTVSYCYNTGSVSGNWNVGGIVGYNDRTVSYSHNTGSVSGNTNVGGVVGIHNNGSRVSYSYNAGSVNGSANVGGVIGDNFYGNLNDVYNTGTVTGSGDYVGGVLGHDEDIITSNPFSNLYNTGTVTGSGNYVGGVIGSSSNPYSNVYNTGSVSGSGDCVGGIMGRNGWGDLNNAYNTGSVSGNSNVGGIVGYKNASSVMTNTYYAVFDNTENIKGTNVTGYKKLDGDGTVLTLAGFNTAFKGGITKPEDQNAWKVYGDHVTPLLKYWLKPVTVTAHNGEYTYTGQAQGVDSSKLSYNGAVDQNLILSGTKTNVGSYGLSDVLYSTQDGYDITVDSGVKDFEIKKAELTLQANGGSITYGDAKKDFGYTVNGLLGADQGKNLNELYGYTDGTVTYTTNAWLSDSKTNNASAEGYDVTINNIGTLALGNYTVNTASGTPNKIIINKAKLTVTADGGKELTYGATAGPNYTSVISGFVNGDTSAGETGSVIYNSAGWDSTNNKTGNAGQHDINVDVSGLSAANYDFEGASAANGLTIKKAQLTVTAADGITLTYGATTGPNYTYNVSGLKYGEGKDVISGNAAYSSTGWDSINNKTGNAGSYDIKLDGLGNLSAANYDFAMGDTTTVKGLTINKAALTAVADPVNVFVGDMIPILGGKLQGLAYDDTEAGFGGLSFSTDANTSVAGSYGILGVLGNTDWQQNYTFTNAEGNATAFIVRVTSDARQEADLRQLLHREAIIAESPEQTASVLMIDEDAVRKQ